MINHKVPALNLYDLKNEILRRWKPHRVNAQRTATHRYTCTELAGLLNENCAYRITRTRVGIVLQALGMRYWQDGNDGCKYYYLSPRDDYGHEDFINPKYKPYEKHQ